MMVCMFAVGWKLYTVHFSQNGVLECAEIRTHKKTAIPPSANAAITLVLVLDCNLILGTWMRKYVLDIPEEAPRQLKEETTSRPD